METPSIGANVDSWCTRCKLMLAHTIEAKVGSKITRVHCNTCGAQHAFRRNPPGEGAAAGRAGGRRSQSSGRGSPRHAGSQDYESLLRGRTASAARPFVASERFKVADLISHPTFGLGVVTADKEGNKIDVLFADGPRTLAHAR